MELPDVVSTTFWSMITCGREGGYERGPLKQRGGGGTREGGGHTFINVKSLPMGSRDSTRRRVPVYVSCAGWDSNTSANSRSATPTPPHTRCPRYARMLSEYPRRGLRGPVRLEIECRTRILHRQHPSHSNPKDNVVVVGRGWVRANNTAWTGAAARGHIAQSDA